MKETIAIIRSEQGEISYIEEEIISPATFKDWFDADFSYEDAGLTEVGENDEGDILYESQVGDFDGQLTLQELESLETGWYSIRYWDGQNWNTDVFERYDTEEVEIVNRPDLEPNPKYYYVYELRFENGKSIITTQSNESGSLSPYYEKDDEILGEREQTAAEKLADLMNENPAIPDNAIDEFDKDPEETLKKYYELENRESDV